MPERDPIFNEFLIESSEGLDSLDQDLVQLEQDASDQSRIDKVFRTIHTIKGSCGFLGFEKLEAITHAGESLLTKVRDGEIEVTAEIATALLKTVDAVRQILSILDATDEEGEEDYSDLIATLSGLQESGRTLEKASTEAVESPEDGDTAPPNPTRLTDIFVDAGRVTEEDVASAVQQQEDGDPRHVGEILVEKGSLAPEEVREALEKQHSSLADQSIRVDVGILDTLMNLVGELVLARNQVLQFTESQEDGGFLATSQKLNLITTELQEQVMKTRMQPIGNVWNKFPRVVRDLATACGKKVRIEMDGQDTEIDKTILEAIKDPLTHLIRNSMDHGIESPEDRVRAGKPEEGVVRLRAFHEGGQVNIEISDDGQGIDLDKIAERAVEKGVIQSEEAKRMCERELLNLIFVPGFSTADKVTNVSGRGVGMDVVRTNIEKIGGTFDIQSQRGQGTQLKVKIPLTLAIIPALIITSAEARYAIPQVSLLELVRLEGEQARQGVEMIQGAPVYRLRGNLLPLVYLRDELHAHDTASETEPSEVVNIVVLQADERQFGVVVDQVNDTQEIVVRPLGKELKGMSLFAGATVMGDGTVALILDIIGLAQSARVLSESSQRSVSDGEKEVERAQHDREETLLLFRGPDEGQIAVPLDLVARLEEFSRSAIEALGGRDVVQYRGEIMPLVYVSEALPERRTQQRSGEVPQEDETTKVQVVVYSGPNGSVGLVVDEILDIVEEAVELQDTGAREGVMGSTVIQGKVTEMLDVGWIVRDVDGRQPEQTVMAGS